MGLPLNARSEGEPPCRKPQPGRSHELPEELESRLRKVDADAALARRKDFLLFLAAVLGVGGIAVLCIAVAIRPGGSADDKKWATAVLTSVVSAAVGFLAGKNSK